MSLPLLHLCRRLSEDEVYIPVSLSWFIFGLNPVCFFRGSRCPDFKVKSRSPAASAAVSLRNLNGCMVRFMLNLDFCVI